MPPAGGQYGGQPGYVPQHGAPQHGAPQQGAPQYGGSGGAPAPVQAMQTVQRAMRTPETKPFFLTSEFLVYLFTVVAVAIAGAVVGDNDGGGAFGASLVWTLITIIGVAYIISRGISKAGQKYRSNDGPGSGGPNGAGGY
jgi:hypothetical protein